MHFPDDVLAFLKGNTLHDDAGGGMLIQVVADEDKTFALPNDARCFSAFGVDMWWELEFPDEVDELNPSVFFDHQYFSDCGRALRVSSLLTLNLD